MIAMVRADNRLVHGQILEAWVPHLGARRILVADDEAARTPLARAAMTLALPPELPCEVVPVDAVDWAGLAAAPEPALVLVREIEGLRRAAARGLTPALAPRLNVGNVHYAPGRRPATASAWLAPGEVEVLRALLAAGFAVELRAVPSDAPLGVDEAERRTRSAG